MKQIKNNMVRFSKIAINIVICIISVVFPLLIAIYGYGVQTIVAAFLFALVLIMLSIPLGIKPNYWKVLAYIPTSFLSFLIALNVLDFGTSRSAVHSICLILILLVVITLCFCACLVIRGLFRKNYKYKFAKEGVLSENVKNIFENTTLCVISFAIVPITIYYGLPHLLRIDINPDSIYYGISAGVLVFCVYQVVRNKKRKSIMLLCVCVLLFSFISSYEQGLIIEKMLAVDINLNEPIRSTTIKSQATAILNMTRNLSIALTVLIAFVRFLDAEKVKPCDENKKL